MLTVSSSAQLELVYCFTSFTVTFDGGRNRLESNGIHRNFSYVTTIVSVPVAARMSFGLPRCRLDENLDRRTVFGQLYGPVLEVIHLAFF